MAEIKFENFVALAAIEIEPKSSVVAAYTKLLHHLGPYIQQMRMNEVKVEHRTSCMCGFNRFYLFWINNFWSNLNR